jgi:hypothetical protein
MCYGAESGGEGWWKAVAKVRKKLQRKAKRDIVFIDQSAIKLNPQRGYGLAPAGQRAVVSGVKPEAYENRYDFMGAINSEKTLALDHMTPAWRQWYECKGWTKELVLNFIAGNLRRKMVSENLKSPIICIDKALSITPAQVKNRLRMSGYTDIGDVVVLPTASAKHISPLDNCLWKEWKGRIRRAKPSTNDSMVEEMLRSWEAITPEHLAHYYRHCALMRGADPYQEKSQ